VSAQYPTQRWGFGAVLVVILVVKWRQNVNNNTILTMNAFSKSSLKKIVTPSDESALLESSYRNNCSRFYLPRLARL